MITEKKITSQPHYKDDCDMGYGVLQRLTLNRNPTRTYSKKMGPPFPAQTLLTGAVINRNLGLNSHVQIRFQGSH